MALESKNSEESDSEMNATDVRTSKFPKLQMKSKEENTEIVAVGIRLGENYSNPESISSQMFGENGIRKPNFGFPILVLRLLHLVGELEASLKRSGGFVTRGTS